MKGFLIPGLFAAAVMAIAIGWSFTYNVMLEPKDLLCRADSPHGPRIGGVILIAGCP